MTALVLSWPIHLGGFLRHGWDAAGRSLRRDAPVYVVVLLFAAATAPFVEATPAEWLDDVMGCFRNLLIASVLTGCAGRLFVYVAWLKPASPIRQIVRDLREGLRTGFLGRWLPLVFASAVFMAGFSHFKGNIPLLSGGFQWDATFSALDRQLHFGTQPWEWLQPLLGVPVVTFALNVNYNLWFFLMWAMFSTFAFKRSQAPGRTRFLLSFLLVWALCGSLLALVFSSAGPCYYALVVPGADPYAGLMAYLHRTGDVFPIWALNVQDMLWTDYRSGSPQLGISAMPSMHNSIALLMVLAARDLHPRLRPWFVAHAVLVFIGSIHLGWHYAVDAYLAFAVTTLIWWGATHFTRRWDARAEVSARQIVRPLPL